MNRIPPAPWIAVLLVLLAPVGIPPRAEASESAEIAAVRRLLKAGDPSARAAALRRLAGVEARGASRVLVEALTDPHPYVRRAAAAVIAVSPPSEDPRGRRRTAAELRRLRAAGARAASCRVFALWADACGRSALLDAVEDRSPAVRQVAVRWLGDPRLGLAEGPAEDPTAVRTAIRSRLDDPDGCVRALALDALALRPEAPLPSARHLRDPDPRVRLSALESSVVGASRPDRACPGEDGGPALCAVRHGLTDAVWSVRLLAAELSRQVPHRKVLYALVDTLADERLRVGAAAHASLVALTGIPFDPDPDVWRTWLDADGATFDPSRGPVAGTPRDRPSGGRTVARPRFLGLGLVSRHVGFVLDASASMQRRLEDGTSRWEQACRELDAALGGLAEGRSGRTATRVNVFVFQNAVEPIFARAVAPSKARRAELRRRLTALRPGGRTALFDGVAAALEDPDLDSIVLLSDGAPSAGAWFTKTDLLREIERLNRWRRARIDVIAVGAGGTAARWLDALRRLAEGTGGELVRR